MLAGTEPTFDEIERGFGVGRGFGIVGIGTLIHHGAPSGA
jgi:hypothetical protein